MTRMFAQNVWGLIAKSAVSSTFGQKNNDSVCRVLSAFGEPKEANDKETNLQSVLQVCFHTIETELMERSI